MKQPDQGKALVPADTPFARQRDRDVCPIRTDPVGHHRGLFPLDPGKQTAKIEQQTQHERQVQDRNNQQRGVNGHQVLSTPPT